MTRSLTPKLAAFVLTSVPALGAQSEQLWTHEFDVVNNFALAYRKVSALEDGGCYVFRSFSSLAGSYSAVTRLTHQGDVAWDVQLGLPQASAPSSSICGFDVDASGSIALVLDEGDDYRLIRMSASGNVLNEVVVRPVGTERALNVFDDPEFTPSGRVLVVESADLGPGGRDQVYVRSFDANGQEEWRTELVDQGFDPKMPDLHSEHAVAATESMYGGTVNLYSIDASGAVAWSVQKASTGSSSTELNTVEQNQSGDIALLWGDFHMRRTLVARFTSAGQEIFTTDLGRFESQPLAIAKLADDGTIYYSRVEAPQFAPTIGLGRLDLSGNVLWTLPAIGGISLELRRLDAEDRPVCLLGGVQVVLGTVQSAWFVVGVDADGTPRWTFAPEVTDIDVIVEEIDVNSRGEVFHFLRHRTFQPVSPRVVKSVHDSFIGTSACPAFTPNSVGRLGEISAVGSEELAAQNVTVSASQLPPGMTTLFLASETLAPVPVALVFGQGLLCLGGSIGRYVGPGEVRAADATGRVSLPLDLASMPVSGGFRPAVIGETWHFQVWHRDVMSALSGGANLTGAVSVTLR